jgi:hypothetical protein
MKYYYNQIPGGEPWRNNLIYTSLINDSKTVFCQWYKTDSDYHKGQNQLVDPSLMRQKWEREIKYITLMAKEYPDLVPKILDIDDKEQKLFLAIDGVDFWQRSLDGNCNFDQILPDWQEQLVGIISAHKNLGLYKYSMHPSSYFIVDGKLKSINYFFTYDKSETHITIQEHASHIYSTRQDEMRKYTETLGIVWDKPQPFDLLEQLCWDSFRTNYPVDFIERVKCLI